MWSYRKGSQVSEPVTADVMDRLCKLGWIRPLDGLREAPDGPWVLAIRSPFGLTVARSTVRRLAEALGVAHRYGY